MKITRTLAVAVTATALLFTAACSSEQPTTETTAPTNSQQDDGNEVDTTGVEIPEAVQDPLNVALVTRITTGSWYETYARAIESEVAALGGSLQIYDSNNDLARMADNVNTAVNSQVDVLLINNGTAEALDAPVQSALDAGISVVTYDSDLTLDGIATIDQDDTALATNGLQAIADDFNNEANLVVLSVAGYAPLDRRLAAVADFQSENPGIVTVAESGTVSGNSALETQAQVDALLKQYPEEGQITAVWSHWNEFTRGAFEAIKQAGRDDVAVYSVDLTDQELPYFWDEGVNFVAASATNPATIGTSQVRLGYQLVAGEDVPSNLLVNPVLIRKSELPAEPITFDQLPETVPAWSDDTAEWPLWLDAIKNKA
ncbi:simple sugar transport system substrate-binding protein [Micrococcales bacterium KH10]|nr:simple sugar transport system substrate-binding protein [Micrococcales bacterium KH10]